MGFEWLLRESCRAMKVVQGVFHSLDCFPLSRGDDDDDDYDDKKVPGCLGPRH